MSSRRTRGRAPHGAHLPTRLNDRTFGARANLGFAVPPCVRVQHRHSFCSLYEAVRQSSRRAPTPAYAHRLCLPAARRPPPAYPLSAHTCRCAYTCSPHQVRASLRARASGRAMPVVRQCRGQLRHRSDARGKTCPGNCVAPRHSPCYRAAVTLRTAHSHHSARPPAQDTFVTITGFTPNVRLNMTVTAASLYACAVFASCSGTTIAREVRAGRHSRGARCGGPQGLCSSRGAPIPLAPYRAFPLG